MRRLRRAGREAEEGRGWAIMAARRSYLIQFYRQEPGDLRIADLRVGARTAEKTATRMLLRHFNNPNVPAELRPHRARVLTYDELRGN